VYSCEDGGNALDFLVVGIDFDRHLGRIRLNAREKPDAYVASATKY